MHSQMCFACSRRKPTAFLLTWDVLEFVVPALLSNDTMVLQHLLGGTPYRSWIHAGWGQFWREVRLSLRGVPPPPWAKGHRGRGGAAGRRR